MSSCTPHVLRQCQAGRWRGKDGRETEAGHLLGCRAGRAAQEGQCEASWGGVACRQPLAHLPAAPRPAPRRAPPARGRPPAQAPPPPPAPPPAEAARPHRARPAPPRGRAPPPRAARSGWTPRGPPGCLRASASTRRLWAPPRRRPATCRRMRTAASAYRARDAVPQATSPLSGFSDSLMHS